MSWRFAVRATQRGDAANRNYGRRGDVLVRITTFCIDLDIRDRRCLRMKALRPLADAEDERGVFTSVADVTTEINRWAEHWNTDPKPFVWKATADDIIEKVSRGRRTLHQIKSQTDH